MSEEPASDDPAADADNRTSRRAVLRAAAGVAGAATLPTRVAGGLADRLQGAGQVDALRAVTR